MPYTKMIADMCCSGRLSKAEASSGLQTTISAARTEIEDISSYLDHHHSGV